MKNTFGSTFKNVLLVMLVIKFVSWLLDLVLNKWGDKYAEIVGRGIGTWISEIIFGKKEEKRDRSVVNYHSYLKYYHSYLENYNSRLKNYEKKTSAEDHASEFYKIQNDSYVIQTRRRAENVLIGLRDMIDSFGYANVATFKRSLGLDSCHRDNVYGWTDLASGKAQMHVDGDFRIILPEPTRLTILASDLPHKSLIKEVAKPDKDRPYNNILVRDLKVAEATRRDIYNLLDTRGKVTMENVYDLLGVQTCEADTKYGWSEKDLDQINIIPGEWGFHLSLPKAKLLA